MAMELAAPFLRASPAIAPRIRAATNQRMDGRLERERSG